MIKMFAATSRGIVKNKTDRRKSVIPMTRRIVDENFQKLEVNLVFSYFILLMIDHTFATKGNSKWNSHSPILVL